MKNLSTLLVAFLLTAGMAYAQNTAAISQVGSNAIADINQTGSNDAIINQVTAGLGISSYIVQVGVNNTASADITSPWGDNIRGAATDQNQDGFDNSASILALNASMDMSAKQTQIGDRNEAVVVTRHDGIVEQTQVGNDNYAVADVVGKAMRTKQIQIGDNNSATMDAGNPSVGVTYQEQIGNDNFSAINSFSSRGSARSNVNTYQEGDFNEATVNFGPSGNFADVDQIGNMNNALIGFGSEFNSAVIMQNGNSNTATISQN